MGLELHQDQVGWDLKHDIRNEEYHQGCVVFSSIHNSQIFSHPEDSGVSDIHPVIRFSFQVLQGALEHVPIKERDQVHCYEAWQQAEVNPCQ